MSYAVKNVLLIDDSEIDVLVNRRLIELTGFAEKVIVTSSGEEALHYLREECTPSTIPDIIFLDMYLPMMSGYDFIEQFKTLPTEIFSRSKIVILSVFQKEELLKKAMQNRFVIGRLEKPLSKESLKSLMNEKLVSASS